MGIGPKGPPLPPNVDFSVVQFPIERQAPGCSTHYQLLMASAEERLVYFNNNNDLTSIPSSRDDVVDAQTT